MGVRPKKRTYKAVPRSRSVEEFRSLSHHILQYANRGVPRSDFQKEVSRMILEFSGCDEIELWVKEHGKYYRCKAGLLPNLSLSFEITTLAPSNLGEWIPAQGDDWDWISFCGEMICDRAGPSPSGSTKYGSFWTGNMNEAPLFPSKLSQGQSPPNDNLRGKYLSLALVPIFIDQQNVGLLQLKSKQGSYFTQAEIALYEDLARSLGIALAHRHAQVDLRERVKELTCLYGIAHLVAHPGISLEEILKGTAELLPSAWLYPEIASARIVLDGCSYATLEFHQGQPQLSADIVVDGVRRGIVEVVYGEERPEIDEGPFYKEERDLIEAVAREISLIVKRREAEDQQAKLQEQLRHADRLATIGQLAAGVAHELNEPLGNILGFAQLAKKCPQLPKQADQDIEKILNASLYAREIVKNLLIFARQMPPQKRWISLNQVVEEGLLFFESRCAKEGVELVRSLDPGLPELYVDPAQLNQVLINLVINALQAMPKGGRLIIQTRSDGDHVSLIVEDTGIGMSEAVKGHIFTPFFTTKDVGQGTGLGLPVVHGIVTSHGGSISVQSQTGKGTRFSIRLPVRGRSGTDGE